MRITSAIGVLAALLGGCPKQKVRLLPPEEVTPEVAGGDQRSVITRWSEASPSLYPALRLAPKQGLTVEALSAEQDIHHWTRRDTNWGDTPVLELLGTDRPQTWLPPVSAWLKDDQGRVRVVVLRDFAGGPQAATVDALLPAVLTSFPGPWAACESGTPPVTTLLADPRRGFLLALVQRPGALFIVDRLEIFPVGSSWDELLSFRGLGPCIPRLVIDELGLIHAVSP